jgi:hypothetical protein
MERYSNKRLFWGLIKVLLLLSVGTALTILGAASGIGADAAPRINLPEITHDFGKAYEDQPLTHTFVIENTGDAPLEIEDVDPDCNCTVPSFDRTIPPGGQGKVTLTIKPFSVLGKFKKGTKVQVNDPERSRVVLTVVGEVQPIIEIKPSHIIRLRGTFEQDLRGQVRFISHLAAPWEITEFNTNMLDKIEVSLKAEEPGKVYLLEVRNKRKEAGRYAGAIELRTTSKQRPKMIVRVFAEIYSPEAVKP